MTTTPAYDPSRFRAFEHDGWQRTAATYDDALGAITREAIPLLLEAVGAGPGMRLLDLASGPGFLAQAAVERGAEAVGLDFSEVMVQDAARRFPRAAFRQGDAEQLPFAPAEFDAVACAFGILHFHDPDRAIAEAHRVLKPGGAFAFSAWLPVKETSFFGMIAHCVKTFGDASVPVPPGPPMFRFGEAQECERVLRATSFGPVTVRTHVALARLAAPEQILDIIARGTVRTKEVLRLQTPEHRARIERGLLDACAAFGKNGRIEIPAPFLVASARKAP